MKTKEELIEMLMELDYESRKLKKEGELILEIEKGKMC